MSESDKDEKTIGTKLMKCIGCGRYFAYFRKDRRLCNMCVLSLKYDGKFFPKPEEMKR